MDWFIFVLTTLAWLTSLFLKLEKKTEIRTMLFAGISLLLGATLLANGISFPIGWTITTVGSTQTIAQTFTDYTQTNNGWILGIGYALLFTGLFHMVEIWTFIISLPTSAIEKVRGFFGIH